MTLNDVVSSNNDIGINTADNTAISLSIYNSNITSNGNVARGTNNVNIGGDRELHAAEQLRVWRDDRA